MMKSVVLALALSAVSAFQAPVTQQQTGMTTALRAGVEGMVGVDVENKLFLGGDFVYDPLGFGKIHDLVKEDTVHFGVWPSPQWLREAELKHSRVAMLAFVGAIVQSAGFSFSGSLGGQYYASGTNFFTDALGSAISTCPFGMAQILLSIYLVESKFFPEGAWLGKMERAPGDLGLNVGGTAADPTQQLKELKNGRAAMIGIMALSASHFIPGSVPLTFPSGF